jgi:hypothetical protein
MARHSAAPTGVRSFFRIRNLVVTSLVLAAAAVFGTASAGGTYALYNSTVTVAPTTISTGSTLLTINSVKDYTVTTLSPAKLYPGRSIITPAPLVFANAGSTPLSFTAGTVTIAEPGRSFTTVALTKPTGSNGTTCVATATNSPLVTLPATTLAAGASVSLCVEVRLATNAPASLQGTSSTFRLDVAVAQVRP